MTGLNDALTACKNSVFNILTEPFRLSKHGRNTAYTIRVIERPITGGTRVWTEQFEQPCLITVKNTTYNCIPPIRHAVHKKIVHSGLADYHISAALQYLKRYTEIP